MNIPKFTTIQIETQHGCNYNCVCCPNKDIKPTYKKMSWSLYKKIINQLQNFTGRISPFLMNEPLLDNRMPDLIRYARENAFLAYVRINTNASLLNKKMADELIDSGLQGMEVSIYTIKADEYKRIHGTTISLEKVKKNLDYFHKKFKGRLSICVVGGHTSATPEEFGKFFGNIPFGICKRINRGGNLQGGEPIARNSCGLLHRQMYIRYTGEAVACCNDYYNTVVLGDCNKQTLMEIWEGEEYNKLRNMFRRNPKNLPEICKKCDLAS